MNRFVAKLYSYYSLNTLLLLSTIPISMYTAFALNTDSKFAILGVLAILGLPFVIILLQKPLLSFWTVVLSSPFNDWLGIKLGGMTVRPYSALTALGVLSIILRMTFNGNSDMAKRCKAMIPIYIPIFCLILSKVMTVVLLVEKPPQMSKFFAFKFVIFCCLLYGTAYIVSTHTVDKEQLKKAFRIWIHIANIIAFIAFFQLVASNTMGAHWVHHRSVIAIGRPYSVFREPDVLGSFYGATIMMLLPLIINRVPILSYRYCWFTIGLHTVGVVTILVRAAWVAMVATAGVFLLAQIRIKRVGPLQQYIHKGVAVGIVMILFLLVVAPSLIFSITDRFMSMTKPKEEGASEYRMRELTVMVAKTLNAKHFETKLLGHGDFSWSYWAPTILGEKYDRAAVEQLQKTGVVLIHPGFCMPLSYLFDNGILGLSLIVCFMLLYIRRFWMTLSPNLSVEDNTLLIATFQPVMILTICFVFSYDPICPFYWVLIGLHLAMTNLVDKKKEATDEKNNNT